MLKRIAFGLITFSFLLLCYAVYSVVVNWLWPIDELPDSLAGPMAGTAHLGVGERSTGDIARATARQAFGAKAWQTDAPISLYWQAQGVFIYADDYRVVDARFMKLTPFSLAQVDRDDRTSGTPKIVTLRGAEALIEFDRAIDISQFSRARPINGKITRDVQIQLNRGTPQTEDDLTAYADDVEFQEQQQRIWTEGPVRIVDSDMVATAVGAELRLNPAPEAAQSESSSARFSGLREAVLARNIRINMLVTPLALQARPAAGSEPPAKPTNPPATRKEHITLACNGPLVYEVATTTARFADSVEVTRQTDDQHSDRLFSDELVLRFKRGGTKAPDDMDTARPKEAAGSTASDLGLKFQSAEAVGQPLRLVSESSGIEAKGTKLAYDAAQAETILGGQPEVMATQAGNEIYSPELRFLEADRSGRRKAWARGPGRLLVRKTRPDDTDLTATWKDMLSLEPRVDSDLLVLKGESLIDMAERGRLTADRVRVWLAHPAKPKGGKPGEKERSAAPGIEPSRIEATGQVIGRSDQLNVNAELLDIAFEYVAAIPGAGALPATAAAATAPDAKSKPDTSNPAPRDRAGAEKRPRNAAEKPLTAPHSATRVAGSTPKTPAKPPVPLQMNAKSVRLKVLRAGSAHEVSEVWTEGGIDVRQPPADATQNPVALRGENLHMKRNPAGNTIEVRGAPAHVEMDNLTVEGAMIGVDQPTGVAYVDGKGWMSMPLETSLEGEPLPEPQTLTVRWGTDMFFDGGVAEFGGGVVAEQESGRLRCRRLEVFLSERMPLNGPKPKDRSAARIAKLVCSEQVHVEMRRENNGQLVSLDRLQSPHVTFDNPTGRLLASGPGTFELVARGDKASGPFAAPAPGRAAAARTLPTANPDQLLLTFIRFAEQMDGQLAAKTGMFRGQVEVLRAAIENENQTIDPLKPPRDAMRLNCQTLQLGNTTGPENRTFTEIIATGNAEVEAQSFGGQADTIKYDQQMERIIVEADPGNYARFWRQLRPGLRPDQLRARKIHYFPKTGDYRQEGGQIIDFTDREIGSRPRQRQ